MALPPAVKVVWDIGIAVGPVIGYFYQYYLIRKTKTVGTFSINLCGVLLFCNILRLGFWFFSKYDTALVVQSLLMITAQIFLLQICVKTMNQEGIFQREEQERDQDETGFFARFWRWKSYYKYLLVTTIFAFFVITISVELSKNGQTTIGDIIGYLSLISESLIMLPQIIENFKQKRVKGLSHLLVFLNNIGDAMKLAYFFLNDQPMQFKACGFIQVALDLTVILQIIYYARKNKGRQDEEVEVRSNKETDQKETKKSEAQTDQQFQSEDIKPPPPADYNELDEDLAS